VKIPCDWLGEWVDVPWDAATLGSRLTMAGFELESLSTAAPAFTNVVIAEIVSADAHPQADKLRVCTVSMGRAAPLQIVCGAANARAGLRTALAMVGADLPGEVRIGKAKLRGVESHGMLASARELGLAEGHEGILELPADAPLGVSLRDYLQLDEVVLDLNVTPNRGDAMSVIGIAREVAALAGTALTGPKFTAPAPVIADIMPVRLDAPQGCPRFAGCIVRGIDNRVSSSEFLRERLRRAGVRSISPAVDVTNYVMLELGQPMHAYDLGKLKGGLMARMARAAEPLTLLDGKAITLQPDMLVIADEAGAVGLAGIMGGVRTAVGPETTEIFFEAAFFAPEAIMGRARRFGLVTDASQRFERGVDPQGQQRAIERALALLLPITGGRPGPIHLAESREDLPTRPAVHLRRAQLARLLGVEFAPARVVQALKHLQMQVEPLADGWQVTPPAYRFDIAIEADLIEEVARLIGFEAIPEADALAPQRFRRLPEERPTERAVLQGLSARGYEEAVTLAFVDPAFQGQLFPDRPALPLANPLASDLSVMRVSLWPGLLRAALENQRRQQDRIRLFEHGTCFDESSGSTREIDSLAALALGPRLPEQWGIAKDLNVACDFFDLKADLMALLGATGEAEAFGFEAAVLPALHPGRSARVLRRGAPVGWIGELHPSLVRELAFTYAPVLFEVDFAAALAARRPAYREISRYPQVRRDLAIVVDESITLSAVAERVTLTASSLLRELRIFDVYRGPGLETGRKSIALGLIFQDISRTLTDDDVERLKASVVADLREKLNAKIRE
jgi:phenylalanyl-tRNA synthetase beta chain